MPASKKNAQPANVRASDVQINTVSINDIIEILGAGLQDFRAAPLYGLFFAGIYALGGWMLILLLNVLHLPFLVYPLAAGFALIAPFIATGLYAVSAKLESGDPLSWRGIFCAVWKARASDIGWMAVVTAFSLFIWMDIAALLTFGFMGFNLTSSTEIIRQVFTTPEGVLFLVIGHFVGAAIAFAVFSFSVISFPMLFDRDIDFVTAMITSVKVMKASVKPMALWCGIIAFLVLISLLSGLLGLFVTLPVLGHASWHLYRRTVRAPASGA